MEVYLDLYLSPTLHLIILYCCLEGIPVDDVLKPIDPEQMIEGCKGKVSPHFPENYKTCVNFYRLLEKMARDGR